MIEIKSRHFDDPIYANLANGNDLIDESIASGRIVAQLTLLVDSALNVVVGDVFHLGFWLIQLTKIEDQLFLREYNYATREFDINQITHSVWLWVHQSKVLDIHSLSFSPVPQDSIISYTSSVFQYPTLSTVEGVRDPAEGNHSGWIIYTENDRNAGNAFTHEHLWHLLADVEKNLRILRLLALPIGWRFQIYQDDVFNIGESTG